MEHLLQFAINIDDDTIEKRIIENAEKNITKDIENEVKKVMFECDQWSGSISNRPTAWMQSRVENFLYNHKDEIIQYAGNILADKLFRTKAVKEMVEGLKE